MSSLQPLIAAQYLGVESDAETAHQDTSEKPSREARVEKLHSDAEALLRHLGFGPSDKKQCED